MSRERYRLAWPFYKKNLIWPEELLQWVCSLSLSTPAVFYLTILLIHVVAYPMGLPEWDTVRLTIEGNEGLDGTAAGQELLDENTAELWVASRIFDRTGGQTVADRLGNNEKTKVVAKLQKPGNGPPGREAAISEEEKKAMMAYYFKKQEEMKKLAESSEDDYLHSSWADSKALQRSLRGQGDVRAPGLR